MARLKSTTTVSAQQKTPPGFGRLAGVLTLAALALLICPAGTGAGPLYDCYGIAPGNSGVCSGHGSCTAQDTCVCSAGWVGAQCQTPVCYTLPATDPTVCGGHGTCINPDNCACSTGWAGNECQTPVCYTLPATDPTVCGGHGTCINPDNCACSTGWSGTQCQTQVATCYGKLSTDPTVCGGHGTCIANDQCQCSAGWSGQQCAEASTTTTTAAADCTDEDNDGYGQGCAAGNDCNDSNPAVHDNCTQCTVRIIPGSIGWLIGEKEKTRFLLAIGEKGSAFDNDTKVSWESPGIETLKTWVFMKRFMFMKVRIDGAQLEKGDYSMSVGGCTGTVQLMR